MSYCKHGRLKRKCKECDMEEEIATLRQRVAEVELELIAAETVAENRRNKRKAAERDRDAALARVGVLELAMRAVDGPLVAMREYLSPRSWRVNWSDQASVAYREVMTALDITARALASPPPHATGGDECPHCGKDEVEVTARYLNGNQMEKCRACGEEWLHGFGKAPPPHDGEAPRSERREGEP